MFFIVIFNLIIAKLIIETINKSGIAERILLMMYVGVPTRVIIWGNIHCMQPSYMASLTFKMGEI